MARDDPQINLRIRSDLKERLRVASKGAGRSLTEEINQRLEASFLDGADVGAGAGRVVLVSANGKPTKALNALIDTVVKRALEAQAKGRA